MAVDLYCGPLVRYYSNDWQTTMQKRSAEAGLNVVRPFDRAWLTPAKAAEAVDAFKAQLREKLVYPQLDWPETQDRPYETVQLLQEGHDALMLWAAYLLRSDLKRPKKLPASVMEDPAVAESVDKNYYFPNLAVADAQLAVPVQPVGIGIVTDPLGDEIFATTTGALRILLKLLNEDSWKVSREDILSWGEQMPSNGQPRFAMEQTPEGPKLKELPSEPAPDDEVEAWARWAMACYTRMLDFSDKERLAIMRDG